MNYISFDFETTDNNQSEKLIALLSEQGFEGFEETGNNLKAFIPEEAFSETAFNNTVNNIFPSLIFAKLIVENINWNLQWEESFKPVIINDFVAIRAGFHQSIPTVQHEIIITPKMSFGTGHHSTTYLIIQQMQNHDFSDKSVLDFGTGTGILAILAEKLGAAEVLAIDNDEWSITNATENIFQNGCNNIIIEQHNAIPVVQKHDIILANINLNVITANLLSIASVCKINGHLLLSGFLKNDEVIMLDSIKKVGFQYITTVESGEWIAITAVKL